MRKFYRFLHNTLLIINLTFLNIAKHPFVYYLPFNIPGKQMAATVQPFGIFIEKEYVKENTGDSYSILKHEMVHWDQYKRIRLVSIYFNYLSCFARSGRIHNWMEDKARQLCDQQKKRRKR
jgi:hypothetical protein